ncbi:MAG: ABC transporter permease [Anaerolineae bacterium]|nr:ABC transporter permease [Anaerolineae bacterium]
MTSQITLALYRFLSNWRNFLTVYLICCFVGIALAAPWISPPIDPLQPPNIKLVQSYERDPLPPSDDIPLGTAPYYAPPDMLFHYDVLHSLIWGTRDALRFGLIVALTAACVGVLIGAASATIGGLFNMLMMRITDAFLAFPVIAGVWLFEQMMEHINYNGAYAGVDMVSATQPSLHRFLSVIGLDGVMLALICFSWMPYARLINAEVLKLKQAEFIMAAKATGVRPIHIIFKHLLPNSITPAIVLVARDIGGMVVLQAALAFIGIGGDVVYQGTAEWARLLLLGRTWIIGVGGNVLSYWWLYVPVTLTLILFGISWNMLGDRLNVMLNPRERP